MTSMLKTPATSPFEGIAPSSLKIVKRPITITPRMSNPKVTGSTTSSLLQPRSTLEQPRSLLLPSVVNTANQVRLLKTGNPVRPSLSGSISPQNSMDFSSLNHVSVVNATNDSIVNNLNPRCQFTSTGLNLGSHAVTSAFNSVVTPSVSDPRGNISPSRFLRKDIKTEPQQITIANGVNPSAVNHVAGGPIQIRLTDQQIAALKQNDNVNQVAGSEPVKIKTEPVEHTGQEPVSIRLTDGQLVAVWK